MHFCNEKEIFQQIIALSPEEIDRIFNQTAISLSEGELYVRYEFTLDDIDGYIFAKYSLSKNTLLSVDMNYNFVRLAGLNNYPDLKDVFLRIIQCKKAKI